MHPRRWLELADEWAVGDGEAVWRTAAGRAYFAAFHLAGSLLTRCGFAVPRADSAHAYVWLRLSNCGHPDLTAAGAELQDLRRARNHADYDLHRPFPQPAAADAVLAALRVADLIEEALASEPVLARVTDAVRAYERDVLRDVTWHG